MTAQQNAPSQHTAYTISSIKKELLAAIQHQDADNIIRMTRRYKAKKEVDEFILRSRILYLSGPVFEACWDAANPGRKLTKNCKVFID
jgi:hypothetical protein